jgi:hypothetical protein
VQGGVGVVMAIADRLYEPAGRGFQIALLRNARKRAIPSLGGRGLLLDLARHDPDRVRNHKHHVTLLAFQRGPDVLGQGLLGDVEKRRPERFVTHGWTSSVPGRWPAGWQVRVRA